MIPSDRNLHSHHWSYLADHLHWKEIISRTKWEVVNIKPTEHSQATSENIGETNNYVT